MSFKNELLSGTFYIALSKYSGLLLSIAITSILARLLQPSEFGILAIASVIIAFINLFTDIGIGPAVIQRDDLNNADHGKLFSLTCYIGILGFAILLLLAHPLSVFFNGNDNIANIVRLMGGNVLFAAMNVVPNALLLRAKQFKLLAIRNISTHLLAGVLAVALAYRGCGVYALAFQSIFAAFSVFLYNYIQHPLKFSFKIDLNPVRKIFSYSVFQMLSSIVSYITRNIDKILVGKYINMSQLGFYEKSFRLISMPVDNISYVITPVMQPLFKDYQNELLLMYDKYIKLLRIVIFVAFPLAGFLYINAADLISLFYGSQWKEAVPTFQLLSLSVPFTIMLATTGPIYQAANKTNIMFVISIEEGIISLLALSVGLYMGGIESVAGCIAAGGFFRFLCTFYILHVFVFRSNPTRLMKNVVLGLLSGLVITLLFYWIHNCTDSCLIVLGANGLVLGIWLLAVAFKLKIFHDGKRKY